MDNLDNKISDTIKDISQKGSSLVEQTQTKVLDIANNVLSTQSTTSGSVSVFFKRQKILTLGMFSFNLNFWASFFY